MSVIRNVSIFNDDFADDNMTFVNENTRYVPAIVPGKYRRYWMTSKQFFYFKRLYTALFCTVFICSHPFQTSWLSYLMNVNLLFLSYNILKSYQKTSSWFSWNWDYTKVKWMEGCLLYFKPEWKEKLEYR